MEVIKENTFQDKFRKKANNKRITCKTEMNIVRVQSSIKE